MIVLGFGHRARQGKNTAATGALESCPLETNVQQYAFADALKSEVRSACNRLGGQWNLIDQFQAAGLMPDWVHVEEPKPRSLLQWWGTEYRRSKNPNYWIDKLAAKIRGHNPDVALITDVRFRNEVACVRSLGGYYVEVVNTNAPDIVVGEHSSESELDGIQDYDFLISAASAEDCKRQAAEILQGLMNGLDPKQIKIHIPRLRDVLGNGHQKGVHGSLRITP